MTAQLCFLTADLYFHRPIERLVITEYVFTKSKSLFSKWFFFDFFDLLSRFIKMYV